MTKAVYELLAGGIRAKGAEDYLFTRSDGKPVRDFREQWRNACVAAGEHAVLRLSSIRGVSTSSQQWVLRPGGGGCRLRVQRRSGCVQHCDSPGRWGARGWGICGLAVDGRHACGSWAENPPPPDDSTRYSAPRSLYR